MVPSLDEYVYIPSDITKVNPNRVMGIGTYDMMEDIEYAKKTIVLTASGTILSVGDLIDWEYENDMYGACTCNNSDR